MKIQKVTRKVVTKNKNKTLFSKAERKSGAKTITKQFVDLQPIPADLFLKYSLGWSFFGSFSLACFLLMVALDYLEQTTIAQ